MDQRLQLVHQSCKHWTRSAAIVVRVVAPPIAQAGTKAHLADVPPSLKRVVFISHSSPSDDSRRRLDTIANTLAGEGYEAIYDRDWLEVGDPWRLKINSWMGQCHVAVALLDKPAADSRNVQHELSVLSYRLATEPAGSITILPFVLDADLRRTDIVGGQLAPTRLGEIQMWRVGLDHIPIANPDAAGEAIDQVILREVKRLYPSPTFEETPLDQLHGKLERKLSGLHREVLEALCRREDRGLPQSVVDAPATLRSRTLARWLMEVLAKEAGARKVAAILDGYADEMPKPEMTKLLAAAQAQWLSPRPHDPFEALRDLSAEAAKPCIAVNGELVEDYTLDCLIYRALVLQRSFIRVECHERTLTADDVAVQIAEKLALRRRHDKDINDSVRRRQQLVFCLLPRPSPAGVDDQLLQTLSNRFPPVIFIAWPGSEIGSLPDHVQSISPPISLDDEAAREGEWRGLAAMLDGG